MDLSFVFTVDYLVFEGICILKTLTFFIVPNFLNQLHFFDFGDWAI